MQKINKQLYKINKRKIHQLIGEFFVFLEFNNNFILSK